MKPPTDPNAGSQPLLDPKNDFVFKKLFVSAPDLLAALIILCAVEIDRSAISVGAGLPAQRGQGRAYMKTGQIQPREV